MRVGKLNRLKPLFLSIIFVMLSSFAVETVRADERYVLQTRVEEDGGRSVTEVYHDQVLNRVVIKEYDREGSTPARSENSSGRITEAWRPSPRGWSLRKVSDFDLSSENSQEQARRALEGLKGEEGRTLFQNTLNRARTGQSRYRLVQVGNRENTQVGLYYNPDNGEFVFQAVNNKSARQHEFASTVGLVTDMAQVPADQTPMDFVRLEGKTYHQLKQSKARIEELMRTHGFQMPEGTLNPFFDYINRYQQNMERIHLKETTSGVFEEVLYHPGTHELLFRRYTYGADGEQNVIEETFYDLNDDVGFEGALTRFQGMGEAATESFKQVVTNTGGCHAPLQATMPLGVEGERNLDDINAVLESLWRSELQAGLPDNLRAGADNTFELNLSLLGANHTLVGNLDRYGRLIDLNFRNPGLARDKKMRIRHIRGDRGEKQFLVEAFNEVKGEWEPQLVLEGEQGFTAEGRQVPRIAAYLRGQQGEGRFNFDGFEKSTYDLNISREGNLTSTGPRYRYDGSRTDEYASINSRRQGEGGVVNVIFHLFFSESGRREKVRETIIEEARRAIGQTDFSELVTDHDIVMVANEVTEATAVRTNNFGQSKNRIEAVATEEAYSRYGDLILRRMVSTLVPTESEQNIADLVNVTMRNFRLCLRRASQARNSDMASGCMDVFMREAPIDVAKEILKLKMIEAGLGDFTSVGERDFLACTQENYDPIKTRVQSEVGMEIIQGCLYRTLMSTVDKVAPALIDQKVAEISRDMNLNLTYPRERLDGAMTRVRSCLQSEGLGRSTPRGYQTNITRLGAMGADLFEQAFMGCVNNLVEDVALSVGEVAMAARLNDVDLTSEAKNAVIEATYEPGMIECMDRQKTAILNLRQNYQRRRAEIVARQGHDRNLAVGVTVPSFDPLECNRVLTNLATGHAMEQTLIKMLGQERYDEIKRLEGKDPLQCFKDFHEFQMSEVGVWLVQNSNATDEEKKRMFDNRDAAAEERSAACLKDGVSMASYYVAQDTIKEKLAENSEYKDIVLSDEVLSKVGASVRACFQRRLENFRTVDSLLEEQERLKDVCAVEMLQDIEVQPLLFTPFIEQSLGSVEMDEATKRTVVTSILAELRGEMAQAKTLDEAMAAVDGFKTKAVPLVLRGVLTQKIGTLTNAEGEAAQREVRDLVSQVEKEIFGEDGQGELGLALVRALESDNPQDMERAIAAIETRAASILGPRILRAKADDMLREGILDGPEDADLLVQTGSEILNQCLADASEQNRPEPLDYCVEETTVKTTEAVLRQKLGDRLANHPLLSGIFNDERQRQLVDQLVTPERMAVLREIAALEDGPAKDQRMADFVLNFKMDATKTVFGAGVMGIITDKLPTPRYYQDRASEILQNRRERMAQRATERLNRCVGNLQERMTAANGADHGLTEVDMDECLNKVRLKLTQDILPKRLEFILHYLHGDLNRVRSLRAQALGHFNQCAELQAPNINAKDYGYHLDGCLILAINNFVGDVLNDMRENEPVLLAGGDQRADWNACEADLRNRAKNHVYPGGEAPSTLEGMPDHQFYAELYRAGESVEPRRPPNLDWLIPSVIECAVQKVVPNFTLEFRDAFLARHEGELDDDARDLIMRLTGTVHNVFTSERADGSPVIIELSSLFGRTNPDTVRPEVSEDEGGPAARPTPVTELLQEFEPLVIKYINKAAAYDPEGMRNSIAEFERLALERLQSSTGDVPLESVVDTLLEGDLTDIVIESMISGIVEEETKKALEEEGANTSAVWLLSSKTMIRRLFGSGAGKRAVERLKREYLRPLLLGQLTDMSIPKELMNDVTDVLVSDTAKGGFVETLFGPIAQAGLNKQRDGIESGWFAVFKMAGAGLIGLNRYRDFEWGNRFDPVSQPHHLRNTPSGQKAVEYFAENLLKPKLRGELTDEAKEEATDGISDLIWDAMGEND